MADKYPSICGWRARLVGTPLNDRSRRASLLWKNQHIDYSTDATNGGTRRCLEPRSVGIKPSAAARVCNFQPPLDATAPDYCDVVYLLCICLSTPDDINTADGDVNTPRDPWTEVAPDWRQSLHSGGGPVWAKPAIWRWERWIKEKIVNLRHFVPYPIPPTWNFQTDSWQRHDAYLLSNNFIKL